MVARSEGVHEGKQDPLASVEIPESLHSLVLQEWQEQAERVTISYFQESIGKVLERMGWPHHSEYMVEELFSVDIVLEVGWPPHGPHEAHGAP